MSAPRCPVTLALLLAMVASTMAPLAIAQADAPPPGGTTPPPAAAPPPAQAQPGYGGTYDPAPPPPPPRDRGGSFKVPDLSVRIDPINWLIFGRLGFELEAEVWKFLSVEVVPVFVASSDPPAHNLGGFPASLKQRSNGLGALSGASISAGFWLEGKPLEGNVLRVVFTNYGYEYVTEDNAGVIDRVTHTERRLFGFFGSHSRWGFFTITGGLGLGVELNDEQRCFESGVATTECSGDELLIRADRTADPRFINLNGALHPAYFMFRLSLGFIF